MQPFLSISTDFIILSTSISAAVYPIVSVNPSSSSSFDNLPSPFLSKAANADYNCFISSLFIIWVVKNVNAAVCSLVDELNSLRFFKASEWITSFNKILSVFLRIQVWLKDSYAVILSSGSEVSIFLTRSIPSLDTFYQIGPFIL